MTKLVESQTTAISQGEHNFVFEHARSVKKFPTFFFAQHHRQRVFFFYHRHAQGFVIHPEKAEPVAHTAYRKLKITLAISVVGGQPIQIGVNFLGCQMLGTYSEMQFTPLDVILRGEK